MKSYSQSQEDLFVLNYFGKYKGTLLEVGANEGVLLSNSKLLIDNGWQATLLEPGTTYDKLQALYDGNPLVHTYQYGLGEKNETVKFYESGNHYPNGTDKGLVSSTIHSETERWRQRGVQFTEMYIDLITFDKLQEIDGNTQYDYISIDIEGQEWSVLQQIDLREVGCKCLCIEWNGHSDLFGKFSDYCNTYGLVLKHRNNENLIFCKP